MTLTKRQFENLRHGCLHKFSFRTLPQALAHMAILNVRNLGNPNPPKHWRKNFDAYDCEFCGHYHIGHKGLEEPARAFKVKQGRIVLSRSLYVQPMSAKNQQVAGSYAGTVVANPEHREVPGHESPGGPHANGLRVLGGPEVLL